MGALADCIAEVYALESCILRAEKLRAARARQRRRHDAVLRRAAPSDVERSAPAK